MTEEKALQLMADIGPHAQEALNSWVSLQWAEFLRDNFLIFLLIVSIICLASLINKDSAGE